MSKIKLKRVWTTEDWHKWKKKEAAMQGISLIKLMEKEVEKEKPDDDCKSWKKRKGRFYGVDI